MGIMAGYVEIIAGTGGIVGQNIWGTLDEQFHADAADLGKTIQGFVDNMTPIRTGALVMDITYEEFGTGNKDIVRVYAENIEQQAYWNRIYVQYQEGGPLGQHTYTNNPHEMFFETAQGAGLAYTELWAGRNANIAIARCIVGAGIPI